MNTPNHSPIPWTLWIAPADSMDEMPLIFDRDKEPVAEVLTPDTGDGRAQADRALLLAAPDLLAACEAAYDLFRRAGGCSRETEFVLLRDALAKARGESPS